MIEMWIKKYKFINVICFYFYRKTNLLLYIIVFLGTVFYKIQLIIKFAVKKKLLKIEK